MARTFTKDLANQLTLGVNAIAPLLAGGPTALIVAQVLPTSYTTGTTDNAVLATFIDGTSSGPGFNMGPSFGEGVIRAIMRSQPADALQAHPGSAQVVANSGWHIVGAALRFTGDQSQLYVDGAIDGAAGPRTFGSDTYAPGTPTVQDRIGDGNAGTTAQKFAGHIEYVAAWKNPGSVANQLAIMEALHAGTHPFDLDPVLLIVLGYQTPDVCLMGSGVQSTIVGSVPFIEGPTGLPGIGAPVNIGTAANTTGTTLTVTVGAAGVPASQTIFVSCSTRGGNLTTGLPSCSDSVDGAYIEDLLFMDDNGNPKGAIFRFSNNAELVQNDTITITVSDAVADHKAMTAWYVDGLDLVTPLGQTANAFGANNAPNSGNITTSVNDALLIGAVSVAASDASIVTQDGDFNSNVTLSRTTGGSAGVNRLIFIGDRIISASETNNYAPTLNETLQWAAGILSYRASGAGPGPSAGPRPGSLLLLGVGR